MLRLSDLERVAPALLPHRSADVRPIDWEMMRTALGVPFPTDFHAYVSHYTGLTFDDFMHIVTPDPGDERDYLNGTFETLEMMRSLAEDDMTAGYRFHPEAGGLLPWGESNEGDIFFWRMSDPDPDRWPAVVYTANADWWEHEGGMLALLVGLIDGSIQNTGLPPHPGPNPTIE